MRLNISGTVAPRVSVVIPTHNGWEYTQECLGALTRAVYPALEIILVDDGSTDGTSAHAARLFPHVHVLRGDGDLWWTGSMNLGIREALTRGADYVLALNNDVTIAVNAIEALVTCALQHPNAVIGSVIYRADQRDVIWCAGGDLKWPWPGEYMTGSGELDREQYSGVRKVKWTPGMGTLMSRDILLTLNAYDEKRMPQYIADCDFALRAGKAGHSVLVTSASKLYNHVENTGGVGIDQKRIGLKEFVSIFTKVNSPEYLSARLTFMVRHCPRHMLVPALLIRYFRIMVYGLKRLMR